MKSQEIKSMSWEQFLDMEEVYIEKSTAGDGSALYFNDEDAQVEVSVDIEKHWDKEEAVEHLRALVIQELEELEELDQI